MAWNSLYRPSWLQTQEWGAGPGWSYFLTGVIVLSSQTAMAGFLPSSVLKLITFRATQWLVVLSTSVECPGLCGRVSDSTM